MVRILGGGWGVGGLEKGGNVLRAMDSQRCKSSARCESTRVVVLLCCRMYIPDLPTYLVFYLETTRGSSIDPSMMGDSDDDDDDDDDKDGNTLKIFIYT